MKRQVCVLCAVALNGAGLRVRGKRRHLS
jgi:hypothetical protein